MDIWNDFVFPEVLKLAKCDRYYQKLLTDNKTIEAEYSAVMEKLTDSEREIIDTYIASCENLEYRLAQLAYELGCADQFSDK